MAPKTSTVQKIMIVYRKYIGKHFTNYNVQSRMRQVVEAEKPTPVPRHYQSAYSAEEMKASNVYQQSLMKNENLEEYLKHVYVEKDQSPLTQSTADRPLPVGRGTVEPAEYGVEDPPVIADGKTTIRLMLGALTRHQQNKKLHSVEAISEQLKLSFKSVDEITRFVKVLEVYKTPLKGELTYAGPAVTRVRLGDHKYEQLETKQQQINRAMKDN